jgi:hypothetical protein
MGQHLNYRDSDKTHEENAQSDDTSNVYRQTGSALPPGGYKNKEDHQE